MAKIDWPPDHLLPIVNFVVTNLNRPSEQAAGFDDRLTTAEPWINKGKEAIKWARL